MENEMARTHHLSMTSAVIVCLVSTQGNGMLLASENECSLRETPSSQSLTSSTSATQTSTSGGLAPAIFIDEQIAGTDLSSAPLSAMEDSRFRFPAGGFTAANPILEPAAQGARRTLNVVPTQSNAFAGQVYQGRPYRMGRDGSIAAIMIGAVATITGAAILVYANRPECDTHQFAGGCGYGTKVIGGAVLSGGVVGLFVGALTWK
jgi:hypothetical protein